jgi:hypothetical protein
MENQLEIPRSKRMFRWFGIEANYRAVTCLLGIGAAIGGLAYFVGTKVLPIYSPGIAATEFGEGYRRGKREAELEQQVEQLNSLLETMRVNAEIRAEVERLSPEELRKELMDGTF